MIASTFTGCARVSCDVKNDHAHKYVNDKSQVVYFDSERKEKKDFKRTDDYIVLSDDEEKLLKTQIKKDLYKIEDNGKYIESQKKDYQDGKEYRYYYAYAKRHAHHHRIGKVTTTTFSYTYHIGYSWTKNKNHENLTGEVRDVHYMFEGQNIIKNDKGKYMVTEEVYYDSLEKLIYNCDYIKDNFYKPVDPVTKKDLSYEDGDKSSHITDHNEDRLNKMEQDEALKYKK